jgi:hypothetical protein
VRPSCKRPYRAQSVLGKGGRARTAASAKRENHQQSQATVNIPVSGSWPSPISSWGFPRPRSSAQARRSAEGHQRHGAVCARPGSEIERYLLARMFAPRAEITSQPDDPARLAAVREEWWVWYALEWSRTDPEAKPFREHQLARLSKRAPRAKIKQTVGELAATFCTAARRAKFRDFFCSARSQAAKSGQRLIRAGLFARSGKFMHCAGSDS